MSFHAHALNFQLTLYPIGVQRVRWWRRRLGERKWLPWRQSQPLRPLDPVRRSAVPEMLLVGFPRPPVLLVCSVGRAFEKLHGDIHDIFEA